MSKLKNGIAALANKGRIGAFIAPKAATVVNKVEKHAPEITLAGGIASGIMAGVKFAKAYKDHDVMFGDGSFLHTNIEYAREQVDVSEQGQIRDGRDVPYDEVLEERKSSKVKLAQAWAMYYAAMARHYAPAVGYAGLSLYLLLTSHGIMKGRNQKMVAVLKVADSSFRMYRERVAEKIGEEEEQNLYSGAEYRDVVNVDMVDGKKKKTKSKEARIPENAQDVLLQYQRMFDSTNPEYTNDWETNVFYLESAEKLMNLRLDATGVVLLNDVLHQLNMPRTPAGALVGWVKDSERGDGKIDFGIRRAINMNTIDPRFHLDFNVEGEVYEQL